MSTSPPIHWGAEALWQQLEPLLPGLSVEVVARTASTNSALLERARGGAVADADAGAGARGAAGVQVRRSVESGAFGRRTIDLQPGLLVAEQQTAGRGRQGRPWHSAHLASLTFSLGLPLATADWSGLSLAVGVALCDALDPRPNPQPAEAPALHLGLKWPNDLWLLDGPVGATLGAPVGSPAPGRKLGGILIETVSAGSQRFVVIGVGLNLTRFDAGEVNTGFAALQELDPALGAPAALARVALPLVLALQQFEREGFAAFAERFAARDLLRGRTVRTTLAEAPEGIARGVSAQGELLVDTGSSIVSVASGEVSVRPAPAA